jgi:RNA polymerase sigma-70 factor (ECF subfamily)
VALLGYVVVDAFAGEVTATRIASHMPLLLGLAFALLVAREHVRTRRPRSSDADADYPPGHRSHPAVGDTGTSGQSTARLPTPQQHLRRPVVD